MLAYIGALLGGLMNRVRGGLGENIPNRRSFNAVIFGLVCGIITLDPVIFLLGTLGMFTGQSLGWGRYIGALGGWENKPLEEVKVIDSVLKPIAPVATPKEEGLVEYKNKTQLVVWGFLAMALRGFIWSLAIFLPLASVKDIEVLTGALIGLLMPICYKVPQIILKKIGMNDKMMWEIGEVVFGALLWYSAIIFLA